MISHHSCKADLLVRQSAVLMDEILNKIRVDIQSWLEHRAAGYVKHAPLRS